MTQIIIFIFGLAVGVFLTRLFLKKRKSVEKEEKLASEKEKGKERIINLLEKNKRITNDEVENLLGVSNTTTYRYLEELEQEEKIVQVGKTGRGVYYEKAK